MHEGAINRRLLRHGKKIFPKIRGFEDALWLRRVGIPGGEIDFLLLSKSGKRIAVIEATSALKGDFAQLKMYTAWLRQKSADKIASAIQASCVGETKRGVKTRTAANTAAPMTGWIKKHGVDHLVKIIEKAKREPHSVLMIFLPTSSRAGTPESVLAEVPWSLDPKKKRDGSTRIALVRVV